MIVHVCNNGKTCLVIYLAAATNNKATTTAQAFRNAVETWHWPSRVRADYRGGILRWDAQPTRQEDPIEVQLHFLLALLVSLALVFIC